MFDRLVLGVDPGLTRCGWGLIGVVGGRPLHVDHGLVRSAPDVPIGERLMILQAGLRAVLAAHPVAEVALERVLFNVNVRTAMATGQAAGIVLLTCAEAHLPVTSYTPTQVKAAVAGFGAADKAQMRRAVTHILGLDAEPQTDANDALALALCHVAVAPFATAVAAVSPAASGAQVKRRLDAAVAAALAKDDSARAAARADRSSPVGRAASPASSSTPRSIP